VEEKKRKLQYEQDQQWKQMTEKIKLCRLAREDKAKDVEEKKHQLQSKKDELSP